MVHGGFAGGLRSKLKQGQQLLGWVLVRHVLCVEGDS